MDTDQQLKLVEDFWHAWHLKDYNAMEEIVEALQKNIKGKHLAKRLIHPLPDWAKAKIGVLDAYDYRQEVLN